MFRPFIIWPLSGWIKLPEKLYNIIQYDTIISVSAIEGEEISFTKGLGGGACVRLVKIFRLIYRLICLR